MCNQLTLQMMPSCHKFVQSCLPVVDVPQQISYPSSLMYDPVDLPSSKLPSLSVADLVYQQMRDSVVPVMMNPLASRASQLIKYATG